VDFVVARGRQVDAIECKIRPGRFDPKSLAVFRQSYPDGRNILVSPGIAEPYEMRVGSQFRRVVFTRESEDSADR